MWRQFTTTPKVSCVRQPQLRPCKLLESSASRLRAAPCLLWGCQQGDAHASKVDGSTLCHRAQPSRQLQALNLLIKAFKNLLVGSFECIAHPLSQCDEFEPSNSHTMQPIHHKFIHLCITSIYLHVSAGSSQVNAPNPNHLIDPHHCIPSTHEARAHQVPEAPSWPDPAV